MQKREKQETEKNCETEKKRERKNRKNKCWIKNLIFPPFSTAFFSFLGSFFASLKTKNPVRVVIGTTEQKLTYQMQNS